MRKIPLLFDKKSIQLERIPPEKDVLDEEEMEFELYAIFKDGILIERGKREISITEEEA